MTTVKQRQTTSCTRKKPGSSGEGEYYHVKVRAGANFTDFRTQDVGKRGHIQRVAGKRSTGTWSTVKWLIGKKDAHVQNGKLIPDTRDAKAVIEKLGTQPVRVVGDRFKAKPQPNIPERLKPTLAQQRARRENIKRAQAARHKK